MKRIVIATAALAALTLTASAADREIGDWMVTTKQSTFKDGRYYTSQTQSDI